jgi:hypothetical protein
VLIATIKKEIIEDAVLARTSATVTVDSKLHSMTNSSTDAIAVAKRILFRIFDHRFWKN